ncbi:hypothetical protein V5J35_002660 [Endozoicomonas sp. NE40]|uniref:Uncharacterized protein n=1 Tax=Endozoicomonas lisbonensis TaxID=3120522 RepID=A0ABV2SKK9_9GAMM
MTGADASLLLFFAHSPKLQVFIYIHCVTFFADFVDSGQIHPDHLICFVAKKTKDK